jgi:hypothetical protein
MSVHLPNGSSSVYINVQTCEHCNLVSYIFDVAEFTALDPLTLFVSHALRLPVTGFQLSHVYTFVQKCGT